MPRNTPGQDQNAKTEPRWTQLRNWINALLALWV